MISIRKSFGNDNSSLSKISTYRSDWSYRNKLKKGILEKNITPFQLSISQKQTLNSTEGNESISFCNTERNNEKEHSSVLQLMNLLNEKRKNKLIEPLKNSISIEKNLNFSIDNLKDNINNYSCNLTKLKNNEMDLNTELKKHYDINEAESNLNKNYTKLINKIKKENFDSDEKIKQLKHENYNMNELFKNMKNEVDNLKKESFQKSKDINQLIEDKKEINTLLIIYQTKNKKLKEQIYNQLKTEKRIKSELKTIINNID
jgi:prefoldin subunit 5